MNGSTEAPYIRIEIGNCVSEDIIVTVDGKRVHPLEEP